MLPRVRLVFDFVFETPHALEGPDVSPHYWWGRTLTFYIWENLTNLCYIPSEHILSYNQFREIANLSLRVSVKLLRIERVSIMIVKNLKSKMLCQQACKIETKIKKKEREKLEENEMKAKNWISWKKLEGYGYIFPLFNLFLFFALYVCSVFKVKSEVTSHECFSLCRSISFYFQMTSTSRGLRLPGSCCSGCPKKKEEGFLVILAFQLA